MVSLLNLLLIFASRMAAVVMLSPRDNPRLGLDAEPLYKVKLMDKKQKKH